MYLRVFTIVITLLAIGGVPIFAGGAPETVYNVVITGGRVMDPESGLDEILNIGILDGKIAVITKKPLEGSDVIDAAGLVVSPGFIDFEQHSLTPWGIKVNLRDGVTTQMDFEVGALNIGEWYAAREGKIQANYGTVVGQESARMRIHDGLALEGPDISMPNFFSLRDEAAKDGVNGWSVTTSSVEEMNAITSILDEGLREGALGIGSTIGYAQYGITTYEMFEAQRIGGKYGRVTSSHHRFHPSASTPTEGPIGVDELVANAVALNAPLQIHHDNDFGWWENQEKMALLREQGYNIWATYYPWIAGSGNYGATIVAPGTWEDVMGFKYEETIFDPQLDRFVTREEFLEFAEKEPGRTLIAYSPPRVKWLPLWTQVENFTVASDSMPGLDIEGKFLSWDSPYEEYAGHPRTAGSHAIVLRIARENGVPLMHSLSQLSYWPAKHLGDTGLESMKVRGRLQEGMVADITIFDAENVTENATYTMGEQGLPSSGIPFVLVNGQVVVRDSVVLKVNAGQSIRFPVEETGRFVPASSEAWQDAYLIKTHPDQMMLDDLGDSTLNTEDESTFGEPSE